MNQKAESKSNQHQDGLRFRLTLTILIIGWLSPLLIPFVTGSSLATEWKTFISGLLTISIPEIFTLAAVAIMGKSVYNLIKEKIFKFLKKHGPPDRISLARYRIGLAKFLQPVIMAWLGLYGAHRIPGYESIDWLSA